MKYILYSTNSDWTESNSDMNTHFGIPDGRGCLTYALISQVGNEENANYGKYIFPVCDKGSYSCTDQFPQEEQVVFDPTWNIYPPLPG